MNMVYRRPLAGIFAKSGIFLRKVGKIEIFQALLIERNVFSKNKISRMDGEIEKKV